MIKRSSLRRILFYFSPLLRSRRLMGFGPDSEPQHFRSRICRLQSTMIDQNLWLINDPDHSPLESPMALSPSSTSRLPGKARREYDKGYQLLLRKDLQGAVEHLTTATSIYPSFVAAHNALGSAYLGLAQNDQARARVRPGRRARRSSARFLFESGLRRTRSRVIFPPQKRRFKKLLRSLPSIFNCSPRWPTGSS